MVTILKNDWRLFGDIKNSKAKPNPKQIQRNCDGISKQMLTNQLRELEKDGSLKKKIYAETPPRVGYSIMAKGKTLFPIIESMKTWGEQNIKKINLK